MIHRPLDRGAKVVCLVVVIIGGLAPTETTAQVDVATPSYPSFGIHVFGVSYHYRESSRRKQLNEVNPGIGVRFAPFETRNHVISFDAGVFRDSMRATAFFVGPVYQFKFNETVRAGSSFVHLESSTYGRAWPIVPLPVVSVSVRQIIINALWMPPNEDINPDPAVAWFLTITF